jgi:hypothetical protein
MADNKDSSTGGLMLLLGGLVAASAVVFILTGGELGGKTTVRGDQDLPPIAKTAPPAKPSAPR